MRFPCLALVLVLTGALASPARPQSSDQLFTATPEQLNVTKILLAQQRAWNAGNLEAYVAFYKDAPDTVAVLASPVRGLQSIQNAYLINFPNRDAMGTLDESEVEVRELGPNFALATGKYHLTRNKRGGGEAIGTFTDIFEKTTLGWRIIFSQNT